LLSHKLGTRDPQAVFLWLVKNGLEKVDPVLREERAEARKTKQAQAGMQSAPVKSPPAHSPSPPIDASSHEGPNLDAPPLGFQETAHQKQSLPRTPRKPLPAALKRKVWIRDQGRCQHVDPKTGRKCEATAFLDYDHRVPLSHGGDDEESNIALSCASHNRNRPHWDLEDQPA
jgi:hypothetical protein